MTDRKFTADEICTGIANAIKAKDFPAVVSLLKMLAAVDPARAEVVYHSMLAVIDGTASEPAGNVIYCRGCRRIWVDRTVSIVALASGVVPADCACECSDPADPLYETWDVNPDEDDLPEGVWVS